MSDTTKKTGNKPVQQFRAGAVQVSAWENPGKDNKGTFLTFTSQRSYKDKDDKWQHTQTLRANDLPTLSMLLNKAFEYAKMNGKTEDEIKEEIK